MHDRREPGRTRDRGGRGEVRWAVLGGVRSGPVSSADLRRLVLDLERDLLQLVGVLLAVVGAEQQLRATRERDTYVGLRATTVAAIGRSQGCVLDN